MKPGTCPIVSNGKYAPKHDPFVFFQDVSGSPPSESNVYCKNHHKLYSKLAGDLTNADVTMPNYVFITPDLSNDMHDGCASYPNDPIRCGDKWLEGAVPPILEYLGPHKGVLFIVWDEDTNSIPFLALGRRSRTTTTLDTRARSCTAIHRSSNRSSGSSASPSSKRRRRAMTS